MLIPNNLLSSYLVLYIIVNGAHLYVCKTKTHFRNFNVYNFKTLGLYFNISNSKTYLKFL